jgi:hypothetical protein
MDCVVCGEHNDGNHHCLPEIENRIGGGRKGWNDRQTREPSFAERLCSGFYILECGEDRHG